MRAGWGGGGPHASLHAGCSALDAAGGGDLVHQAVQLREQELRPGEHALASLGQWFTWAVVEHCRRGTCSGQTLGMLGQDIEVWARCDQKGAWSKGGGHQEGHEVG